MTPVSKSDAPVSPSPSTSLIYIIPPYLLNTCMGSQLQKQLAQHNEQLSLLNVITPDSPYHHNNIKRKHEPKREQTNQFSPDPYLNAIIKEKVLYKLAILGILGTNPMEFNRLAANSDRIFELYEIFKNRLIEDDENADHEKTDKPNLDRGTLFEATAAGGDSSAVNQPSIFKTHNVGEVNFNTLREPQVHKEYKKYMDMSLRELITLMKLKSDHKFKLPPSFVHFGNNNEDYFKYPLPISWAPLIPNKYLNYLSTTLNMEIDNSNGNSYICLSTPKEGTSNQFEDLDLSKPRYFNFITDKPICSSSGIFYYEIEIVQEITEATNFKPIISMSDASVNSDSSLNLCAGFTKRYFNLDDTSSTASSVTQGTPLDLEKVKEHIFLNDSDDITMTTSTGSSSEIKELLGSKPGEFKGSFAVNFEDSNFYNSIKNLESLQRSQLLNMNRRMSAMNRGTNLNELDCGKIDLGIPFKTRMIEENYMKRIHKTDIIGCGVNFINRSIFITLNGVFTRVITYDELVSSNPSNDNLFSEGKDNSIYPMIGFKLNDLEVVSGSQPSKLKIKTNFGFKEFKLNMNNYVNSFKQENQKFLYLSLLDKIQANKTVDPDSSRPSTSIERSLLNINEDSQMLNKLIKGYLNHEGYINTFKAFDSDLKSLSLEIDPNSEQQDSKVRDDDLLMKSHTVNRSLIKKNIMNKQFDEVLKFLEQEYPSIIDSARGAQMVFDIKLAKFIHIVKLLIECKKSRFESDKVGQESEESELYQQAIVYRETLVKEYRSEEKLAQVNQISSLLLVESTQSLLNLPKVCRILDEFDKQLVSLWGEINREILVHGGFKKVSNLENIFENVDKNINTLSLNYNDDKFMLINFEKDHMDL
ncbi:uncharacterized protein SPAPADRAFT_142830 [Spathaspora passalidarum NRRL Y-27907]|uniref:CTLH domain-containing protein n=1 Tax=Spathaspora passalidarum (strain NRRL Y-27907 / 11-Y1) TaxID=619300 RepID=G3ASG8_SPAPN|nr:uncharacterized protein SPAPADRAFT_142830 [Spathaspora passalidarum NRRL Y-27907]EGW31086.1 hypothetical protein SPAPADRAFT_142830 [Spathaspora passalidarum NRRL Y-27907]